MKLIRNSESCKLLPEKRANSIFVESDDSFYLIGGGTRNCDFNDIWRLTFEKKSDELKSKWQLIKIIDNLLTPRAGCAYCRVENNIYIHGGQNFSINHHFDDFFELNTNDNTLKKVEVKSDIKPSARNSHTMNYEKNSGKIILYGGADDQGPLDDIYMFDIKDKTWIKKDHDFSELGAREMHSSELFYGNKELFEKFSVLSIQNPTETNQIFHKGGDIIEINFEEKQKETEKKISELSIEEKKENEKAEEIPKAEVITEEKNMVPYLFIIGGRTFEQIHDQILCVNLNTWEYRAAAKLSSGVCCHSSSLVKNQIFIMAGASSLAFLSEISVFNILSNSIYKLNVQNYEFGERIAISSVVDHSNSQILIFGGMCIEDEKNDLYSLDYNKTFEKI